jgi:hypothetical protein
MKAGINRAKAIAEKLVAKSVIHTWWSLANMVFNLPCSPLPRQRNIGISPKAFMSGSPKVLPNSSLEHSAAPETHCDQRLEAISELSIPAGDIVAARCLPFYRVHK